MKEVVPNKIKSRLIDKIRHKVWITIDKFKMFTEDDNILVGVSGGKDSLVLLEALAYLKIVHKPDLKITAIHINIKNVPYELDRDYFDSFCKELNIPYIIKDIDIDFDPNHKKGACFVCSWHRRKTLFDLSKEQNFNKVALGHHMDDAVETMLMNMIHHGSISSMPPTLKMFDGRIDLIRPLLYLHDDDLKKYSEYREFVTIQKSCPYEDATSRKDMRNVIENLKGYNKSAKLNMFNSMSKIYDEYNPSERFKFKS